MVQQNAALNGDMSQRVCVDTQALEWTASPSGTVMRKRLHLVGEVESGQVTSLVRYVPNARFPPHDHPDGEEILVLSGTFSDESGDHPAGSYLLNPEGFRHAPFSEPGCLLFVKLRQYDGDDRPQQRLDVADLPWTPTEFEGVERRTLFRDARYPDRTDLERWAAGTSVELDFPNGAELFVMEGAIEEAGIRLETGTWLRLPPRSDFRAQAVRESIIYIKRDAVAGLRSEPA